MSEPAATPPPEEPNKGIPQAQAVLTKPANVRY